MKKALFALLALLFAGQGAYASCAAVLKNTYAALSVHFYNYSTGGSGLGYLAASISYGDGSDALAFGSGGVYSYASSGTYYPTLTVYSIDSASGDTLCTSSCTDTLILTSDACTSTISYATLGLSDTSKDVGFTATTAAGASGMSYAWSFGDGGTDTGATADHAYFYNGTYPIVLIAKSASGCSDTVYGSVYVDNIFICAAMSAYFTSVSKGGAVKFTNLSTKAGTAVSYTWTFGDGSKSAETAPTHMYTASGKYASHCKFCGLSI